MPRCVFLQNTGYLICIESSTTANSSTEIQSFLYACQPLVARMQRGSIERKRSPGYIYRWYREKHAGGVKRDETELGRGQEQIGLSRRAMNNFQPPHCGANKRTSLMNTIFWKTKIKENNSQIEILLSRKLRYFLKNRNIGLK